MRSSFLFRGSLLILIAATASAGACNAITGADVLVFDDDIANQATGGGEGGEGGSATTPMGGSATTTSGETTTPNTDLLADAAGITITQVAIYQGVKIVLMEGGQTIPSSVPIVAGRDALMRVWLSLDAKYDGKPVVARLRINGVAEPIEVNGVVTGSPTDQDLGSTLNFTIPGASIVPGFAFRVELLQPLFDTKGANAGAYWPDSKGYASTNAVSVGQSLKIVLVPIKYGADGSNRLPDTTPAMIQSYTDLFYGMYPAPAIDLTVRDPVQYNQDVDPNGYGWSELLDFVGQLRQQDGAAYESYYYGIFAPAASFGQFCSGGCVAGLGNLGGPGESYLRAAIGLGYQENGIAVTTAVHEIGHTHGRQHSPCGGAAGTDPQYPYSGADIGVWGYHLLTQQLFAPKSAKDVMGYCEPYWISDFTYSGILNRIKAVNMAKIVVPDAVKNLTYDRAQIDETGDLRWLPPMKLEMPPQGEPLDLDVEADGGAYAVEGHYFPFDHLPGGVLVWPQAGAPSAAVTLDWKGSLTTLARE